MTGHRWRKPNPLFADPYPLVRDAEGKYELQSSGFRGICHQLPGQWFWTGFVVVHGTWWHFCWPDLEVAAYDLHRHMHESHDSGPGWIPATWFPGHFPRSIKQKTGRPSIAASWRLSLSGNVLSLRLTDDKRSLSIWHVFWNGQRVVANKGFEWFATESAQQAAEDFDQGSREAYRLR